VILVLGLIMGILGGAIGHLVFGKNGKKEHKCISHKWLGRKGLFLKMLDFVYFRVLFVRKVVENVWKSVLFFGFWRTFVFGLESRVEKSSGKIEKKGKKLPLRH